MNTHHTQSRLHQFDIEFLLTTNLAAREVLLCRLILIHQRTSHERSRQTEQTRQLGYVHRLHSGRPINGT